MDLNHLVEKAKQAYGKKHYRDSGRLFGQASEGYLSNGDLLMSAEMRNNQSVSLLQSGNGQAALDVVVGTERIFAEADDLKRQGMALANKGAALESLKRKPEAIECYVQSARLLEIAGETDLKADVMRSIASLQVSQGKFTDAVMSMQDGLIEVKKPTLKQRILKKFLFLRLWR